MTKPKPDNDLRDLAVQALREDDLDEPQIVDILVALLNDWEVRLAASEAMARARKKKDELQIVVKKGDP